MIAIQIFAQRTLLIFQNSPYFSHWPCYPLPTGSGEAGTAVAAWLRRMLPLLACCLYSLPASLPQPSLRRCLAAVFWHGDAARRRAGGNRRSSCSMMTDEDPSCPWPPVPVLTAAGLSLVLSAGILAVAGSCLNFHARWRSSIYSATPFSMYCEFNVFHSIFVVLDSFPSAARFVQQINVWVHL
jgi:hypothetical protein